jgi:hypothetical protein
MMLARAAGVGGVWTAFGELQHVGQGRRVWETCGMVNMRQKGIGYMRQELQKTRRSVGGSKESCIGVGWAKRVTACIMNEQRRRRSRIGAIEQAGQQVWIMMAACVGVD